MYIIITMNDQHNTDTDLAPPDLYSQEDEEETQQQQQTMYKVKGSPPLSVYLCIGTTVALLMFVVFQLTTLITQQAPKVVLDAQKDSHQGLSSSFNVAGRISVDPPEAILKDLQNSFTEVDLSKVPSSQQAEVERLNERHVLFQRTIRSLNYGNALLSMASFQERQVDDASALTYGQYLRALGLLQLTTQPFDDESKEKTQLTAAQYKWFKQRWGINTEEQSICAVMLLSAKGLNNGDYYYAIRSLFQQHYTNSKLVFIDDTPQLGMQAQVLGLIKQLATLTQVVVADRIEGQPSQGSAIYYAIHTYCSSYQITLLLTDSHQLIGQQVFALLNQAHLSFPLLISHYLLDQGPSSPSHLQYQVPLYPQRENASPRTSPYKTKFIKSFKTSLLKQLPLSIFQLSDGQWRTHSLEALIEFAALEKSCGQHLVLDEILCRVPKTQLQSSQVVLEAQHTQGTVCQVDKEGNKQLFQLAWATSSLRAAP